MKPEITAHFPMMMRCVLVYCFVCIVTAGGPRGEGRDETLQALGASANEILEERAKRARETPRFHGYDCIEDQEADKAPSMLMKRPEACQEENLHPRPRLGKVHVFDLFHQELTVDVKGQYCRRIESKQAGRCGMQSWYELVREWELNRPAPLFTFLR